MKKITLSYEIHVPDGMRIFSLIVHHTILELDDLDEINISQNSNILRGSITIKILNNDVRFEMNGVSTDRFQKGKLNFSINGKKVFEPDEEFGANAHGRIAWRKEHVVLPL